MGRRCRTWDQLKGGSKPIPWSRGVTHALLHIARALDVCSEVGALMVCRMRQFTISVPLIAETFCDFKHDAQLSVFIPLAITGLVSRGALPV
jgi:hypothetical protein